MGRVLAQGDRLRPRQRRRRPEHDRRVRLREPHRARCTSATGARRPSARRSRTCSRPTGWRGAPRVLRQRRRPPDGHPRGERVAALSRVLRRIPALPGERVPRRLRPPGGERACARSTATRFAVRRRRSSPACRPTRARAATRTSTSTRSSRGRGRCSAREFRTVFDAGLTRHARRHQGRPRRVRRHFRPLVLGAGPRRRARRRTDRPRPPAPARQRSRVRAGRRDLVPGDAVRRREGPRRGARQRRRRPTSPPTSPTTSTSASAASTCS